MANHVGTAATLAAAFAGAALAALAGIPAGALIGSTMAVALLAAAGLKVGFPGILRDLGFATIGISPASRATSAAASSDI